ncbi:hypothetical protein CRI94_14415 [Longibacter salinarum]|uniref:Sulfatase N-terminal domain-containing protein n=1 Tax=Longibacter salinarum TaxID=1850348 RepID=A0A2A8CUU0_9BACT|nr:hypothetical protein [Longibacter salinarum]PEN12230.1 hypothetical protein CRI94_14415 [Longibacter salinarum]
MFSTIRTPEDSSSWRSFGIFLGAWLLLNLLPFLPATVSPLPISPYAPLSVDVLVLLTFAVLAMHLPMDAVRRWGLRIATAGVFFVLFYQIYDAVAYTAFQRSGLFAEDVQYLVDVSYFALDSLSWQTGGLAIVGLTAAAGLAWIVPHAVRLASSIGAGSRRAQFSLATVHLIAWPIVFVIAPAQEWGTENLTYQTSNERTRVRTVAAKVTENAQASARLYTMLDTLGRAPVDSTYFGYENVALDRKPHVYLYMIESLGEVLKQDPELRGPYRDMMSVVQDTLSQAGWHSASALSEAPVRGGRSWLAIASVLLGTRVDHQLLYERFQGTPEDVPSLVRFLSDQGYLTVTCQPYTVARPGLEITNPYGFDVLLHRDDLDYEGPTYGWGVVPMSDQYSLGVSHERHLKPAAEAGRPFFYFFETVLSHALWNYGLPPVIDHWSDFNEGNTSDVRDRLAAKAHPPYLLPDSITAPRIFDQPAKIRYLRHVAFEMEVLVQYLLRDAPDGSLVILMGDHQPPIVPSETFDVPIHILSRDPSLVQPFTDSGFVPGLRANNVPQWKHEGLFSLTVRSLVAADTSAQKRASLPPLKPEGVPRSIIVR